MKKKILSLALTLALSLSLVTPALAVSVTEIPIEYDNKPVFSEGLAAVRNDQKLWGFIDQTGKQVIPYRYKEITPFQDGTTLARNEDGKAFLLKVDDGKQPTVPGTFSPDKTCTRGQIVIFLYRDLA